MKPIGLPQRTERADLRGFAGERGERVAGARELRHGCVAVSARRGKVLRDRHGIDERGDTVKVARATYSPLSKINVSMIDVAS